LASIGRTARPTSSGPNLLCRSSRAHVAPSRVLQLEQPTCATFTG
jgi:hypothetical protein